MKKLQQGLLRLENAFNREPKMLRSLPGNGCPGGNHRRKTGFKLSRPQLVHRIHESLCAYSTPCVTVPGERIDAAITARLLRAQGITTLMSTFTLF